MSSSKNPSLHLSTQALFSSNALGTGDPAGSAGSPPKRSAPWAFTSPGKSSGGCWHPTDPKKLDGFFSETDFLGTPQYHILELLMQPTTEIHKTAEQLGPWSLLWKVSDAGPGNREKPLRMLL